MSLDEKDCLYVSDDTFLDLLSCATVRFICLVLSC
jgi:hypothetical protein